MIVDDEYSYIQNQHKLDINELSHTYMTNKQNKEIIKLKKKVAMLERKLNAKTSNYIWFSILNSLYNTFIDDISDTHKAYNDERKSLVKKHKLNNRSFAFSKNMNLCTHSKNSNYKKGIISNQNSTDRLYSYKENDVSPFLKSYSTFTTPRKSDKRESAETPMICKVYPEQFPTKDEFSMK